jgi:aminoglycoside phosphotransferase (APT) family kinase protein
MRQAVSARLARVSSVADLPAADPVLVASDSNDVWRIGSVVLRICWRGDRDRFAREAAVTAALPPGIPYPQVLDTGQVGDLAWQLTRAVDGTPLAVVWPRLTVAERCSAIGQIGQALQLLHAHVFPPDVTRVLAAARPARVSAPALIGADLNPVPVQRALLLAGYLRRLPYVDARLVDDAIAMLRDLIRRDPFDSWRSTGPAAAAGFGCVHGDAHPANVLWRDGGVVALLDFEWVRIGPPDLELMAYLRFTAAERRTAGAATRAVLSWLADTHPAAFAAPDLADRLLLYELAYTIRHLLLSPPGRPASDLGAGHPLHVLVSIMTDPGRLRSLLP